MGHAAPAAAHGSTASRGRHRRAFDGFDIAPTLGYLRALPMDVTCERCGTEYEFDETLVSDRGTTVKCTNCGHLFKVFRKGAGPSDTHDRVWRVRHQDGRVESLESLRELQRRITQGILSEDDEISRGDDGWKKLGSIAELQTFFAAARSARSHEGRHGDRGAASSPSTAPAPRPSSGATPAVRGTPIPTTSSQSTAIPAATRGTATPSTATPPQGGSPSHPPPTPARAGRKQTLFGVGPGAGHDVTGEAPTIPDSAASPLLGVEETMLDPSKHPSGAGATAAARPGARTGSSGSVSASGPTVPSPSVPPGRPSARPLYVEEDEDVERPVATTGGRTGLWVSLVILLALAGGVALKWDVLGPMLGLAEKPDPVAPFLAAGDAALAKDDVDGYRDAEREYTRATAMNEKDPRVLVALARVHGAWAQALLFHASDLDAQAAAAATPDGGVPDDATPPPSSPEAARAREEAAPHIEQARRFAEDAVRVDPSNVYAEIVVADALRLSGELAEARRHLDRARSMTPREPPAELSYVAGLLAMAEGGGNVTAATGEATAAARADGSLLRARLLAARALLAGGDVAEARAHLAAVMERRPGHPRASRLLRALDEGIPPARPLLAVLDAGVPDAGAASDDTPAGDTADDDTAEPADETSEAPGPAGSAPSADRTDAHGSTGSESSTDTSEAPRGRDYSWYIRRGEELLERGDTRGADSHFQAALEVRPNAPEALTGLGFVALERGDANGAAHRFRPAARAGYGDAYIGLGDAYRRLGRDREALEAYQSYLERRPNGPRASIARRQVDELRLSLAGSSAGGSESGGSGSGGAGASDRGAESDDTGGASSMGSTNDTPGPSGISNDTAPSDPDEGAFDAP